MSINVVEQSDLRTPQREKAAILNRLFIAPRPDVPDGKLQIWANGKLLTAADGVPLPEGQMPFEFLRWFPTPGKIYPLPFLSPMRDVQREINTTLSQLVELKNRQLRGDLVMVGSGPTETRVNPETNQRIITLPPNVQKFEFLKYDLNITNAEQLLVQLWNYMMTLAGLHESSLGQKPSQARTAFETATLKEADMAGLTLFRSGFDSVYNRVDGHKLLLAKNHYKAARLLRVTGADNTPRVKAFYGADLRDTEDIQAKPVPILTEADKLRIRQEAIQQGLFDFSGGPTIILAKARALLALPLPGIREEVDRMLAPMSLEELEKAVGILNALGTEVAVKGAMLAKQQADQIAGAEAGAGEPPMLDQMGNPVEPSPGVATLPHPPGQSPWLQQPMGQA
jgi:hypothetical protein